MSALPSPLKSATTTGSVLEYPILGELELTKASDGEPEMMAVPTVAFGLTEVSVKVTVPVGASAASAATVASRV